MIKQNQKNDVPRRRQRPERDSSETQSVNSSDQYRRNQTLPRYSRPTPQDSGRRKAHTLAEQRRKLGGIVLMLCAAVIFLALLLWQLIAQVQVTSSTKQLARTFDASTYEQVIDAYFLLNPAQRLKFLLNEQVLQEYVRSQLPEVEALQLKSTPGLARADFSITFRTPVAAWQMRATNSYVDGSGVVFETNYYVDPTVQVVDESGIEAEQGRVVASGRLLAFLGRIVAEVGEKGYTVARAVLPPDMTREVDIYLLSVPTRVKLSIDRGAGEQAEDMSRALKFLEAQGQSPEYIDVRVEGKAAYR